MPNALPPLATTSGIEDRMGSVPDRARARAAIEDASALIHHHTNYLWVNEDGTLSDAVPPVVATVAYKVVRRALANPDDLESEQLGPYQATFRRGAGDVYLTSAEKEMLSSATGAATGLSSIRVEAPWGTIPLTDMQQQFDQDDDL